MTRERDDYGGFDAGSGHPATVLGRGRGARWPLMVLLLLLVGAATAAYVYFFERNRATRWLRDTPLALPATVSEVYKWRDASGNWNITDRPPAGGLPYEVLRYRSDNNVTPALPREHD